MSKEYDEVLVSEVERENVTQRRNKEKYIVKTAMKRMIMDIILYIESVKRFIDGREREREREKNSPFVLVWIVESSVIFLIEGRRTYYFESNT